MRMQVDVGHRNYMKQSKGFGNSNIFHKKSVARDYLREACSEHSPIPLTSVALRCHSHGGIIIMQKSVVPRYYQAASVVAEKSQT